MSNLEIVKLMFSDTDLEVVERVDGAFEVGHFLIFPCKMDRETIGGRKIEVDGWGADAGYPPTGDVVELGNFIGLGRACRACLIAHAIYRADYHLDMIADDAAAKEWNDSQNG